MERTSPDREGMQLKNSSRRRIIDSFVSAEQEDIISVPLLANSDQPMRLILVTTRIRVMCNTVLRSAIRQLQSTRKIIRVALSDVIFGRIAVRLLVNFFFFRHRYSKHVSGKKKGKNCNYSSIISSIISWVIITLIDVDKIDLKNYM